MSNEQRWSIKARCVFSGDGEPLPDATVEIENDRIVGVHRRVEPAAIDLGGVAVIPGLVNAHTHLEFSDLNHPLEPSTSFADWIRAVVAHRRRRTSVVEAVRSGLDECARAGTTLVADIVTDEAAMDGLVLRPSQQPLRVVPFRELLGRRPDQKAGQLAMAERFLASGFPDGTKIAARGLSPHAPYSVHPDLYEDLIGLAARRQVPVAVHLAETRDELQLLREGGGPLVQMLREFGVWSDGDVLPGRRPLDSLKPLAGLPRALVIHGNYLDADEIAFLCEHPQVTLVYCPRTHAYFSHSPHPWLKVLDGGGSVALGTDSRASNPDLSVFAELQFLARRFPQVPKSTLLQAGTVCGARALGLAETTGSLAPGKSADLAVVALAGNPSSDPWAAVLDSHSRLAATMCAGRWLFVSKDCNSVAIH